MYSETAFTSFRYNFTTRCTNMPDVPISSGVLPALDTKDATRNDLAVLHIFGNAAAIMAIGADNLLTFARDH
jgi:hypothetical protein